MACCPYCGRSCWCGCGIISWSPSPEEIRRRREEEFREELARFLAAFELRAADKAAARRDEFLRPSRQTLPPPRSPKRNRVCSKAELWRARS